MCLYIEDISSTSLYITVDITKKYFKNEKKMYQNLKDWFWTDSFWLPYGFKWSDVKEQAPMSTLYLAPFVTVIILIVRYLFERYFALNLCLYLGIAAPSTGKVNVSDAENVENEKQNARGLRKSKRSQQAVQLKKATETCWRCFAYFLLFAYGAYVLLRTDWFWSTRTWLEGYIKTQQFTNELKAYYIAELSFYLALLITHFKDTKRKDFMQQFVHHIATIILICGSYVIAHMRYGSVIMLVHDASDYWLEAAKLAKYANKKRTCDVLFVIFAIVFYVTRWIYFPFWVCGSFIVDNAKLAGPLQSHFTFPYLFLYLCFVLQALHLYWGFLIGRMVYQFTVNGKLEKDERSDDED